MEEHAPGLLAGFVALGAAAEVASYLLVQDGFAGALSRWGQSPGRGARSARPG